MLFGPVQAERELKERTLAFLAEKTGGYTKIKAGGHACRLCAAACACLLLMILGGRWLYFAPTAEISIDINPSIEMDINRFDRVISVSDFNEDGRQLSHTLDVKYKSYTDAVEQILRNDAIAALLSENEVMTITVVGPDGRQAAEILSEIEACTAAQRNTYCYFALSDEVSAAHEAGLSCGKYRAFLELQTLDPKITPEAVRGMTMREIRELMDSLSADGGNDALSGGWGGGRGHGGGRGDGWRGGGAGRQSAGG